MEVQKRGMELSVDEILPYIGEFGRFQKLLDLAVFIVMCPAVLHPILMYFSTLVPDWKCNGEIVNTTCVWNGTFKGDDFRRCHMSPNEWHYVEGEEFSLVTQYDLHCDQMWLLHLVTSMFFVGQAFGSFVAGWLADQWGRKTFVFPFLIVTLLFGFVTPFVHSIYVVIVCRFVIGFAYSGVVNQVFVFISELVGTKMRPTAALIPYLSEPLMWMVLALQAYLLKNWKTLSIICTAPYIFVLGFYPFIPESVRWLQAHDRSEEAMKIFRNIARWNKKELPSNICLAPPKRVGRRSRSNFSELVRSRRVTLHTCGQVFIWTFISLSFLGLQLSANDLEGSTYTDFVLLTLMDIPSTFIAIGLMNKLGRKKTTVSGLLITGTCLVSIAFIPSHSKWKIWRIVLGMLGKLCVSFAYKSIYVSSSEILPTNVRAVGMGILQVCSRIGSTSSPWVSKGLKVYGSYVPFLLMGVASVLCSLIGASLPETSNVSMSESNALNANTVVNLEPVVKHGDQTRNKIG